MSSHSNSGVEPKVPAEMLADRKKGWVWFTQFTVWNCVAIAALLLLMLAFLR